MKKRAKLAVEVEVPRLPNYVRVKGIRLDGELGLVDVAHLTPSIIRDLGKRWTEALLAHADKRQKAALRVKR